MQRGDERVLRTMSSNDGARFSEESFAELVEKARTDPEIQHALHSRGDVPYTTRTRLVGIAREVVDAALQNELGPDALPKVEAAHEGCGGTARQQPRQQNLAQRLIRIRSLRSTSCEGGSGQRSANRSLA